MSENTFKVVQFGYAFWKTIHSHSETYMHVSTVLIGKVNGVLYAIKPVWLEVAPLN